MHLGAVELLVLEVLQFVAESLEHCGFLRPTHRVILGFVATDATIAVGALDDQPVRGDVIEDLGLPVGGAYEKGSGVKPLLFLYLCQFNLVVKAESMFLSTELSLFFGHCLFL